MPSPFLALPESAHIAGNALAFAVADRYPVSPGHTLVVPRREVRTWFDATRDEQVAILELVDVVKGKLDGRTPAPEGYTWGSTSARSPGRR